jgi:small conductance mechanosensitive channel
MTLDFSHIEFEKHLLAAAFAMAILVVGWTIAAWSGRFVRGLAERSSRMSPTLIPLFEKLMRLTILSVVVIAALEKVGVQTTSFLAVLGAAGLAIGLALKDTVSDVASGIVLLVLRPFDVGEAVDIGGTGGIVEAIDIFQTRLTSFEGVPTVLGNASVRGSKIANYSRAARRRIDLEIGVSYRDDLDRAREVILAVLRAERRVLGEPESLVDVTDLGDSAVVFLVRFWTAPADFLVTKLEVTRRIKQGLDTEGIQIPFPQRDVHLVQSSAA